jgi:hypothetical protein
MCVPICVPREGRAQCSVRIRGHRGSRGVRGPCGAGLFIVLVGLFIVLVGLFIVSVDPGEQVSLSC